MFPLSKDIFPHHPKYFSYNDFLSTPKCGYDFSYPCWMMADLVLTISCPTIRMYEFSYLCEVGLLWERGVFNMWVRFFVPSLVFGGQNVYIC